MVFEKPLQFQNPAPRPTLSDRSHRKRSSQRDRAIQLHDRGRERMWEKGDWGNLFSANRAFALQFCGFPNKLEAFIARVESPMCEFQGNVCGAEEMPIISSFFSFHALIQCNRLLRRSAGNRKVRRTCSDYFITISILTGLVIVIQRTIPESAIDDLNDAFASAVIPYELGE